MKNLTITSLFIPAIFLIISLIVYIILYLAAQKKQDENLIEKRKSQVKLVAIFFVVYNIFVIWYIKYFLESNI